MDTILSALIVEKNMIDKIISLVVEMDMFVHIVVVSLRTKKMYSGLTTNHIVKIAFTDVTAATHTM